VPSVQRSTPQLNPLLHESVAQENSPRVNGIVNDQLTPIIQTKLHAVRLFENNRY
jgi:hypothetical protein